MADTRLLIWKPETKIARKLSDIVNKGLPTGVLSKHLRFV